jgi:ATP-dependent exoDNAse (exonuclease V) beta subunit
MMAKNWPSKTNSNPGELIAIAETKLIPIVTSLIKLHSELYAKAMAAEAVLQNLYVFGLIADISRKLKEYKDENNLMLLADAPKFLNGVIQNSDTPFIYEKVGSFYRNYLIDEFQDTSLMQWKNFLPLLTNSLDQGYTSLVVGDVKQAIYRWRGGDLKLLQEDIENQIGSERVAVRELNSNYRSAATLVDFNNLVFEKASSRVVEETEHTIAAEAYRDVRQQASQSKKGFVRIRFIEDTDESMWKDEALKQIPHYLEKLQGLGVPLKDIAILVRTNDEGQQIVANLLKYKDSAEAKKDCLYDVVSNESLRLDGAASVNLLLGAMKYLANPDDVIARAQLGYEFAKLNEPNRSYSEVFAVTSQVFFESNLPESFAREKGSLKKLPLFELTETLISIFQLGEETGELAYLLAFQNLVLDFYTRERNDLGAFLQWWEDNKQKKSIQVSGEVNAVQILTIHKAKGLQFKHVIIPFCAWSLDHEPWKAPNLWVTSDEAPFSDIGFVPVKYSSSLTKTTFNHYYEAEKTRTYLDNLNLLYVAFTRAEIGLIVLAPYSKQKKSVSQLLFQSIDELYSLSEQWNSVTHELNLGEWSTADISSPSARSGIINLSRYGSFRWRDKLVIRKTPKQYLDPATKDMHDKITYGIYIHTVFSRITHAHEIPNILDELVLDGTITQEQRQVLQHQLDDLLANSQIASWFSPEWDVRTEIPIIVPDGSENRIDRLLLKGRKAIVVDFKTGEPTKADQKQVQEYIGILRQMNYADVEGYLLYIKDKEIVSVLPGKIKTAGKKDKQQLDLGF